MLYKIPGKIQDSHRGLYGKMSIPGTSNSLEVTLTGKKVEVQILMRN
jgi:hypothetical protein